MPKQPVGYLPSHQSSLDPSELSFGLDLNSVKPWGVGDEPSQLPNCDHQYEDRHMFNPRFSFTIRCIVGEASQDKPIVNHCCCLPSWIMFCNIHRPSPFRVYSLVLPNHSRLELGFQDLPDQSYNMYSSYLQNGVV